MQSSRNNRLRDVVSDEEFFSDEYEYSDDSYERTDDDTPVAKTTKIAPQKSRKGMEQSERGRENRPDIKKKTKATGSKPKVDKKSRLDEIRKNLLAAKSDPAKSSGKGKTNDPKGASKTGVVGREAGGEKGKRPDKKEAKKEAKKIDTFRIPKKEDPRRGKLREAFAKYLLKTDLVDGEDQGKDIATTLERELYGLSPDCDSDKYKKRSKAVLFTLTKQDKDFENLKKTKFEPSRLRIHFLSIR